MFGRHKKGPKIGDVRVTVVQDGVDLFRAVAEHYTTQGFGAVSWKCWDAVPDTKQLHAPYETIINYFEAPTAEEACEAAHHMLNVIEVRRNWAAAKREC